ncbi:unnamed protein product [Somion occarium]|uniref:Aminoglycoside phosphotransferase domain-containing protein n=1 Tax=Somion occarium TaxID=3059160 RepID=A0ABP1CEQ1_9APHY
MASTITQDITSILERQLNPVTTAIEASLETDMPTPEYDLATIEGVFTYLGNTPFSSDEVTKLAGGLGNYTYRIHLRTPHEGRTSLVLKHAKAHLPNAEWIPFPLDRQMYEAGVLTRVKKSLPLDSLVTVPAIHLFDDKADVIIMDDCGVDVLTLKQLMLEKPPSIELARSIGEALGNFLAFFHTEGTADQELLDFLAKNETGRQISSWATYGRLVSTLSGKDELPALPDPPLDVSQDDLNIIEKVSKELTDRMMTTRESVVMGDFWPGNILISLSSDSSTLNRIYVVDWEMAKAGVAGVEIGQFAAEMHLLRRFHSDAEAAASATLSAFLTTYGKKVPIREGDIPKIALIHVGAHLVTWCPRVAWEGKEKTREVIAEGVRYLVEGYESDREQIRKSLVGELYP